MSLAKIVRDDPDVDERLSKFGAAKAEFIEIALAAQSGRADAIDDDPLTTPGTFSYIFGTRSLRKVFRAKGWRRDRADGIESVINDDLCIKIVFQNADSACDTIREPKSISGKGNAAVRAVALGQGDLFAPKLESLPAPAVQMWYFFVFIDGDEVKAELSRPVSIDGEQFFGFHERIFIIKKGDLGVLQFDLGDNNPSQDYQIKITKK